MTKKNLTAAFTVKLIATLVFCLGGCAPSESDVVDEVNMSVAEVTTSCGNGTCEAWLGESCKSCKTDCGDCPACGDLICSPSQGENTTTCVNDCGYPGGCGDHQCLSSAGETCKTCPSDCGACIRRSY